jgi:hypothetical protein
MHVNEQDEVALVAQQRRRQKARCIGGLWLFIITYSMMFTRIYREDLHRVTASCNRLVLPLIKCIRHGLVEKINGKRRPQTCETLGQISADYSCTRRAPARERAYVPLFLLSSTHL